MGGVSVHNRPGRELVVVFFAVQRLFYAAVVALTLLVALAVLKQYAFFVFGPVVAVVGVEVTLVEAEFGYQHRVAGELVEVGKQSCGGAVYHDENVKIV